MNTPAKLIIVMVAVAASAAIGFRTFGPATTEAPPKEKAERKEKAPDNRAEQDEHGADRIYITDVKLAAGGVVLAEAGPATLSDTLQFNGVLRANQEAVVQVTPRFPGIVRSIRKRIGDQVVKDEQLASIESNQSLTVYDLKAPISGTVIDRQISLGEYASEQKPAFVVADLSTIWVDLSVYRQDLKRVRIGDEVLIDPEDAGGDVRGKVSYVAPIGASDTQTALARVVLPNADGRLRPGLFVTSRLILDQARGARRSATDCDPDAGEQDRRVRPGERRQDRGPPRRARQFRYEVRRDQGRPFRRRTLRGGEQLRGEGRDGQGGGGPP